MSEKPMSDRELVAAAAEAHYGAWNPYGTPWAELAEHERELEMVAVEDAAEAITTMFLSAPERFAPLLGLSLGGELYRGSGDGTGVFVRAFYIAPVS